MPQTNYVASCSTGHGRDDDESFHCYTIVARLWSEIVVSHMSLSLYLL
jgi:hypothetical protein